MEITLERLAQGLKKIIGMLTSNTNLVMGISNKLTFKHIDNVCYEFASNQTMFKAKGNAFEIGKVQCSFIEFDAHSHKLKSSIDIYLSFAEALCLCQDIKSGRIAALASKEKAISANAGKKYASPCYTSPLGGISEEKAKARGLRDDGKAISRSFNIAPGAKADYVFTAMQGAGHTDQKLEKLIVPEGNPEIIIRVPCSERQLKSLALMLDSHIKSYFTALYTHNGYAQDVQE